MEVNVEMEENLRTKFQELQDLQAANVNAFTKSMAVNISIISIKMKVATGLDVFQLWNRKLLHLYGAELTAADGTALAQCFYEEFSQMILGVVDVCELNPWQKSCLMLLKRIKVFALLGKEFAFFILILKIINELFTFYCKWGIPKDLKQLETTKSMLNVLLDALKVPTDFNVSPNELQFSQIIQVIDLLCAVCVSKMIGIKNTITIWRTIVTLMGYCKEYYALYTDQARRPVQLIFQEIQQILTVIHKQGVLKRQIVPVRNYIEMLRFYTNLLRRLGVKLTSSNFPAVPDYFQTYRLAHLMPKTIVDTEDIIAANNCVLYALNDILHMIVKKSDLRDLLLDQLQREQRRRECFHITRAYLEACVASKDVRFIEGNVDAFITIFDHYFKDADLFVDTHSYDAMVELYAALAILNTDGKLRNYFRSCILQDNFCKGFASCDVLLVLASGNFEAQLPVCYDDFILREYNFWQRSNESFAVFSTNIARFHVQTLLRCCYKHCRAKNLFETDASEQNEMHWMPNNLRLLLALGPARTFSSAHAEKSACNHLVEQLYLLLGQWDANCTIENYYKMIANMELLSHANVSISVDLLQQTYGFVGRIFKSAMMPAKSFDLLLNAVLRLATAYMKSGKINESGVQYALQRIKHGQTCQRLRASVPLLFFLKTLCCIVDATNVNAAIRELAENLMTHTLCEIEGLPWRSLLSLQPHQQQQQEHAVSIGSTELFSHIRCYFPKQAHKHTHSNDQPQPNKRIRLCGEHNGAQKSNLKCILLDLTEKSKQAVDLISIFDAEDYSALRVIVNNLNTVMKNFEN